MQTRSDQVRPAVQAGRFYESDPHALAGTVQALLDAAPAPPPAAAPPGVLVVPHAGYLYSGAIAAAGYRAVAGNGRDHVLVLAPSHHERLEGAALSGRPAFATPLGEIALDGAAAGELAAGAAGFAINEAAHDPEHAIEVQLPFLQLTVGEFTLLPVLLGGGDYERLAGLAGALADLLARRRAAGERWLTVVSTDTYHGYDAAECRANDERLRALVEQADPRALYEAARAGRVMACGWRALALGMLLGAGSGGAGRTLARGDSALATGREGGYVVGYLAAALA